MQKIATALKPNIAILGYALFLAINAASVWGGVFPFIPMSYQTPEVLFWFSTAYSAVFLFCYLASSVGVYFFPGPTSRFIVGLASAPYLFGWCFIIAGIYISSWMLEFAVAGGACLGLGSAGFYMLWQRLFSSQDSDEGNRNLIVGTAYSAVLYFSLYLVPQALTVYLIPFIFLPLFGLAIALSSRTIDLEQAIFQDIPRHHPKVYKHAVQKYWREALCIGAIGLCSGLTRAFAIEDPAVGHLVNSLSMAGSLAAAALLLAIWTRTNLKFSVSGFYHLAFPCVISAFALLPILASSYDQFLAALLYALFSAVTMLLMVQCAQISRDQGINPIFVYAVFGGIVYALHSVGLVCGMFAIQIGIMDVAPRAVISLVAIYLLGLMYFIERGGIRASIALFNGRPHDQGIELVALPSSKSPPKSTETAVGKTSVEARRPHSPDSANSEIQYQDRLAMQIAALGKHYRLTSREIEVADLIARGNTVARIAQILIVSENTVKTHSKRIYAKLGVHKRQDLLDLIELF